MIRELEDYSINIDVIDPHASATDVKHEYDIELKREPEGKYDAIIVAVGHREFLKDVKILQMIHQEEILIFDLKGIYGLNDMLVQGQYWRL